MLVAMAGAAAAAPPEHALELSRGAAEQAAAVVQELNEQIEETGAPQGTDSEAFAARHAELADKHADNPGNAAAVHEALAAGESASTAARGDTPPGQARRAEVSALNAARKALENGEKPGRGLGRGNSGTDTDD